MAASLRRAGSWLRQAAAWMGLSERVCERIVRRPKRAFPTLALERLEDRTLLSTLQAISLPPANQPPSGTAAGASLAPSVSADGRYIAFTSSASNLVPGQTGEVHENVFLLDGSTGAVVLVSHDPGMPAASPSEASESYDENSSTPLMSQNGQYVAYNSIAPELVGLQPGTGYDEQQVVVYNVATGLNTLVSHSANSPTTQADEESFLVAMSADGRFILFSSIATDLVADQVTTSPSGGGLFSQLFLYDQATGTTSIVSHAVGQSNVTANSGVGALFPGEASVADDGTVAYESEASNLISGFSAFSWNPDNVYLYNPTTQANQLVSFVSGSPMVGAGFAFTGIISADGSTVVYTSSATDVVPGQSGTPAAENVFSYNRSSGATTLMSGAGGSATVGGNAASGGVEGTAMAVDDDGQVIAFRSDATDLVPGQNGTAGNVFVYNARSDTITLASGVDGSAAAGAGGVPDPEIGSGGNIVLDPITADGPNPILSISGDGLLVAYVSQASDLVTGQTGPAATDNVFLYSSTTGESSLVSGADGSAAAGGAAESSFPMLSADGNLLVFHSLAYNLIPGLFDGNGVSDVFTYTPGQPGIALVSRPAFAPSNTAASFSTSTSADGRYTVFTSSATNLVPNEVAANPYQNIYLYDDVTGTTTLINHAPGLANTTGDNGLGSIRLGGFGDNARPPSYLTPVISADGSYVAFASFDDNLVPGEGYESGSPGAALSVYLYDVQTGQITIVDHVAGADATIDFDGASPAISSDGAYVAYIYGFGYQGLGAAVLYNRLTDTTTFITALNDMDEGNASNPEISDDGRFVAYLNNNNVYVYDSNSGTSTLVSHDFASPTTAANSSSYDAVISHDGSTIAFVSAADDLVGGQTSSGASGLSNVFLNNVVSGAVSLVSGVNGSATVTGDSVSDSPAIDGDGGYVAFRSYDDNLVAGQSGPTGNIFEFNTQTNTMTLVSNQAGSATAGAGGASEPVIDDDGHLVSYASTADDLIPGQSGTTGVQNIFVWLRQTGANILASGQDGSPTVGGNADSDGPLLTRDSFPGFSSPATNLVNGVGGVSVAYINTLVSLALSPNTIASGSPAGTAVGSLTVNSLLFGSYLPPTFYPLDPTEGDNAAFALAAPGGAETLYTGFTADYAAQSGYTTYVTVDVGFGPDTGRVPVFVAPPPVLTVGPPALPAPPVGTYSGMQFTASGGAGPYTFAVSSGQLPTGLALDPNTGALSGTPTDCDTFAFTVTAADSGGAAAPGSQTYTLAVSPATVGLAPANSNGLNVGAVGAPYTQALTASGGTAPYTFRITGGALPAGLSLDPTTGGVSGTPTAAGSATVTIAVADSSTGQGAPFQTATTYTFTVNPVQLEVNPPGPNLPAAQLGTAYGPVTFSASGGTPPYTFKVVAGALPPGLALSAGGALGGTPLVAGAFSFTVQVTDSSGGGGPYFARFTYTLTVGPLVPYEVAVIPGAGVWRHGSAGWQQLTPAAASLTAVDARGDVAVEIPGAGVWRFEDAVGWRQLTPADVTQLAVDARGDVAVEIAGAGVWRYEDAGGWQQLTPATVTQLGAAGSGIVAVEIPGAGVWRYEDATGWRQLTPADVTQLAVDARGDVAVEIAGAGVWRYEDAGGWQQLTPADAARVGIAGTGAVAVDLPGAGVWRFEDAGGWEQLDGLDASQLAVDSRGDVLAQLSVGGLWLFQDAGGWSETTPVDALFMGLGG